MDTDLFPLLISDVSHYLSVGITLFSCFVLYVVGESPLEMYPSLGHLSIHPSKVWKTGLVS